MSLNFLHPVGVVAHPPSAVSLYLDGREVPTSYIALTISSKDIMFLIPLSAISAEIIALETPIAFLVWQGTSTIPATGSQISPRRFAREVEAACKHSSGVPPKTSTKPDAAMAHAEPTSAWHPASAPETEAFFVII